LPQVLINAENQQLPENHYCAAATLVRVFLDCDLVLSVPVETTCCKLIEAHAASSFRP
jgi:hypothetical protein